MNIIIAIACLAVSLNLNAQRTLTIGALPFNTPFTTQGDSEGHFYGFEISMMNEICRRINVQCTYHPKTFRELFKSVFNGDVDIGLGALIITKGRKKKFLFSLPYFLSSGRVIVVNNNKILTVNDLQNKTVGALKDSVYETLLQRKLSLNITVRTYPMIPDMLMGLMNGSVDAILIDEKPAEYWAAKGKNLKLIGQPIPTGSGYAIITNKSNKALIKEINRAIIEMEQDGTYLKLYNDFF